jgi:hypothetical protein
MSHPKCATCAHFHEKGDAWDAPEFFGYCGLVQMTSKMSQWSGDRKQLELKPEFSEHLAGTMDGSSYRADFYPHPDFYCPMHSDLMPQLVSAPKPE